MRCPIRFAKFFCTHANGRHHPKPRRKIIMPIRTHIRAPRRLCQRTEKPVVASPHGIGNTWVVYHRWRGSRWRSADGCWLWDQMVHTIRHAGYDIVHVVLVGETSMALTILLSGKTYGVSRITWVVHENSSLRTNSRSRYSMLLATTSSSGGREMQLYSFNLSTLGLGWSSLPRLSREMPGKNKKSCG